VPGTPVNVVEMSGFAPDECTGRGPGRPGLEVDSDKRVKPGQVKNQQAGWGRINRSLEFKIFKYSCSPQKRILVEQVPSDWFCMLLVDSMS